MSKKVLIGTVTLDRDLEMDNNQFGYAADHERLMVRKGSYPIYAFDDDLQKSKDGKISLGWRNQIGLEGDVISSTIGGKPGEHTSYHQMVYDYTLADLFCEGHEYHGMCRMEYELRPEWGIELHDFRYDGKRHFSKEVVLLVNDEIKYMEEEDND